MRRFNIIALLACLALAGACQRKPETAAPAAPVSAAKAAPAQPAKPALPPDVALLVHFAGTDALAKNPDTQKLSELLQLPASQELIRKTMEKLAARAVNKSFAFPNGREAFDDALRPVLNSISSSESAWGIRTKNNAAEEWCLAVRVGEQNMESWRRAVIKAALTLLGGGGDGNSKSAEGPFLVLRGGTPESLILFYKFGECPGVDGGNGQDTLRTRWTESIKSTGLPVSSLGANWLRVAASPQFAKVIGWPAAVEWPRADFAFSAHTNSIRAEATLAFDTPPALNLAPLRVPTNSVQEPLVSFSVGQGFGAWLQRQPAWKKFEPLAAPNQFFAWSRDDVPVQTYATVPLPDAAAQIPRAAAGLEVLARGWLRDDFIGQFLFVTNRSELIWRGPPVLVPFLRAAPEPGGDVALFGTMAGIVPRAPNTNPPPAALLAQVAGRTNLVYYDWEITPARLQQWGQINQLVGMLTGDLPSFAATPGQNWLNAIMPKLGNTVTEITATDPRTLRFTRKSELGLTAIELLEFARWLDNLNFPAWKSPPAVPMLPPPIPGAPPAAGEVK